MELAAAFAPERLRTVLLPRFAGGAAGTEADAPGAGASANGADADAAAVAAILAPSERGPEALFIERAANESDPWSGHMAFPGGRAESRDADSFSTAARETSEELSIDISDPRRTEVLGRLNDLQGGPRGTGQRLRVTPHVCWWSAERPQAEPNYEVADTVWMSLADLADQARHVSYTHPKYPGASWPAIQVDERRVIWGLTLRMLEDLFSRAGLPLSGRT